MSKKHSIFCDRLNSLFYLIIPVTVLILSVSSAIIAVYNTGYRAEFSLVHPTDIFLAIIALAIIIICLAIPAWFIINLLKIRLILFSIFIGIVTYYFITSIYLPIPIGDGMMDLANYDLSNFNLSVGIIIALLLMILTVTNLVREALLGLLIASIVNIVPQFISLFEIQNDMNNMASTELLSLSGKNDIIIIGFDGVQQQAFKEALQENSVNKNKLNDFTMYENALSSSPATTASLAGMMIGNRNFKAEAKDTPELIKIGKKEGLVTKLHNSGYKIGLYGVYNEFTDKEFGIDKLLKKERNPSSEFSYLLQIAASRSLGGQIASSANSSALSKWFTNIVPFNWSEEVTGLSSVIDSRDGIDWDKPLLKTWDDFQVYKNIVSQNGGRPTVHFLHFLFTHHPVDFDENCKLLTEKTYDENQNYSGMVSESICAIQQFEEVLNRLSDIGAYEDNLIILASDHGAPSFLNEPDRLEGKQIRNSVWGYGRYRPILLVKKPKQSTPRIQYDDRPVILDDLALSICEFTTVKNCDSFSGMNIFNPDALIPEHYFINIVQSGQTSFTYEVHETVKLPRTKNQLEALDKLLDP